MKRKKQERKAFTLVELLVVILIISMLAAFVAPRMFKGLGKAKRDIARAKMAIIEDSLARFYIHCGRYPDDSEGLDALLVAPTDLEEKWSGPYCKQSDLLDPWDERYLYFKIQDLGQGMDKKTLSHAIEPFYTTKEPGKGLGLGLFLAESAAERFGGKLKIFSEPGRGTTVLISFSLKQIQCS